MICPILSTNCFFVFLPTLFHMCFYFYYHLLILIKKFSRHRQVNVSFYEIKYLYLLSPLIFFVSLLVILVIVSDFYLFIYIDDYRFI
jgi:hypothetical protein